MACNFANLLRNSGASKCKPQMPGTGDSIYVFDIDDCFGSSVPEPKTEGAEEGFYDAAKLKTGFAKCGLFEIEIKVDSGQVTSDKNEDNEGRSLVGTAIVDHSVENFLKVDEAMAFRNMGALFPDNAGNFYVIMSPYKRTKYTCNYDSGTTYDSDHGFTITFTASPVLYGCPKVKLTSAEVKTLLKATEPSHT